MSHVIIFKLEDKPGSYDDWYNFLLWRDPNYVIEASTWDDSYYSKTIYKAYEIKREEDLTYILLKWSVTNRGNYDKWIEQKRRIESTVYTKEDIRWIPTND